MTYAVEPGHDWRTERFSALQPETLIGLIGETVYVGLYGIDTDEFKIALTGTVHAILDESGLGSVIRIEMRGHTDSPPNVKWDPKSYYALITWDAA